MTVLRNIGLPSAAVVALLAIASPSLAQNTATGSASAAVTVARPITITKNTDLSFGRVVPDASTAGTVVIGTGADTATPTTVHMVTGGTITRAKFTVGGEGGQAYSIALPGSALSLGGPTVDTWTTDVASPVISGTLGSAGTQIFYVGATLHVPANQAAGSYTGSFNVTVTYQ